MLRILIAPLFLPSHASFSTVKFNIYIFVHLNAKSAHSVSRFKIAICFMLLPTAEGLAL
jgi:hypothetical protein